MDNSSIHSPIPAEARGQVRLLKRRVAERAAQLDNVFGSFAASRTAEEMYRRSSAVGRARAARALDTMFHSARREPELCTGHTRIWAMLRTREAVIRAGVNHDLEPGMRQSGITVDFIVARRGELLSGLWTLEVPDHALGRLCQRAPRHPPEQVIFEAHRTLLRGGLTDDWFAERSVWVPAGPGVLACDLIIGEEVRGAGPIVIFRARTWLHEDQLQDGQVPVRAGDAIPACSPLLPLPLREIKLMKSAPGHRTVLVRRVG